MFTESHYISPKNDYKYVSPLPLYLRNPSILIKSHGVLPRIRIMKDVSSPPLPKDQSFTSSKHGPPVFPRCERPRVRATSKLIRPIPLLAAPLRPLGSRGSPVREFSLFLASCNADVTAGADAAVSRSGRVVNSELHPFSGIAAFRGGFVAGNLLGTSSRRRGQYASSGVNSCATGVYLLPVTPIKEDFMGRGW